MELQDFPHGGNVALIVGVTGLVGLSLAEALKSPTVPGGPWQVYGGSRRPLPPWFPPSTINHFISFDATDSSDTLKKLSPLSDKITHLFWVAIQAGDTEETKTSVNCGMLENVLLALTRKKENYLGSSLQHICLQTGTKHYMGPIFDPILGSKLKYIPETPFKEETPRLNFPNSCYALEDLVASFTPAFSYSVHRASLIFGASSRSLYNILLDLCLYALICKHEVIPFRYPGTRYTWDHFFDASDARLLAEQQIWAAVVAREDNTKNEAFNCTNGDVITGKMLWKKLCEIFDLELVPFDDKFDLVDEMKDKGNVWDLIVERHGLYETKLDMIASFPALKLLLSFEFQHVSSMNKSKEFGFFGYQNTMKSVDFWVQRLREMKIIP